MPSDFILKKDELEIISKLCNEIQKMNPLGEYITIFDKTI